MTWQWVAIIGIVSLSFTICFSYVYSMSWDRLNYLERRVRRLEGGDK